jgi:hypothetical protein
MPDTRITSWQHADCQDDRMIIATYAEIGLGPAVLFDGGGFLDIARLRAFIADLTTAADWLDDVSGRPLTEQEVAAVEVASLPPAGWPFASCCGEPRVTPAVDRCYDHAKVCDLLRVRAGPRPGGLLMTALLKRLAGHLCPELLLDDDVYAEQVTDMWADVYGEAS